ncbi:unnamed protein product [Rhodiola kirilowii]
MDSSDEEKDAVFDNDVPKGIPTTTSSDVGTKFVDDVLNGPNDQCLDNFRMGKHEFYKLCDILQSKGLLRHTNRIKIEEQIAIFMFVVGHNLRTRAVQELFRYSGETISRHFNNVLNAIVRISLELLQPSGSNVSPEDARFYPYFKDCVGIVDGMHLPVMVGIDEQGPFRNKSGLISQHVIAACSFDMEFKYVLAGWEGSADDLRVLVSAITRRNKLQVPEGKYYLVDSKYANIPGFIAPYPGVPYQSTEFVSGMHPQDAKELFNHRHAVLRSASECLFGALKSRFPILISAPPYPLQTQVRLVIAACALHNFIHRENPNDWIFKKHQEESSPIIQDPSQPVEPESPDILVQRQDLGVPFSQEEIDMTSRLRDSIAEAMWNDYIQDFSSM